MWRKVVVELWSYYLQTFRQDGDADRSNVQVLVAKEPNFKILISVLLKIALPLCLAGYQGTLNGTALLRTAGGEKKARKTACSVIVF
jgi:hypothetical protein